MTTQLEVMTLIQRRRIISDVRAATSVAMTTLDDADLWAALVPAAAVASCGQQSWSRKSVMDW